MDNLVQWIAGWDGRLGTITLRGHEVRVVDKVNGHTLGGAGTTVFETSCLLCGARERTGLTDAEMAKGALPHFECPAHRGHRASVQRVLSLADDTMTVGGRDYRHTETLTARDGTDFLLLVGQCKGCEAAFEMVRSEGELKCGVFLPYYCLPCRVARSSKEPKSGSTPKVRVPREPKPKALPSERPLGSVMAVVLAALEEQPHLDDPGVCRLAASRLPHGKAGQGYKRAKRALASLRSRQLAGSLA